VEPRKSVSNRAPHLLTPALPLILNSHSIRACIRLRRKFNSQQNTQHTAAVHYKHLGPALRGVTRGTRGEQFPGCRKSQKCRKYFLQCSKFTSERAQIRTWGHQTCFLPKAPSNLVMHLLALQLLVNFKLFSYLTHMRNVRGLLLLF